LVKEEVEVYRQPVKPVKKIKEQGVIKK